MSKTEIVTLSDDKQVTIELLPLRAYGNILVAIQEIFSEVVNEWAGVSEDQIVAKLPEFITNHIDEVAKVIEIGTRGAITAEEIANERGLADAIDLATAILIVNDVERMVTSVKKAMAAFQSRKMAKQAAQGPHANPSVDPFASKSTSGSIDMPTASPASTGGTSSISSNTSPSTT